MGRKTFQGWRIMTYIIEFSDKKRLSWIMDQVINGLKNGPDFSFFHSEQQQITNFSYSLEFERIEDLLEIKEEILNNFDSGDLFDIYPILDVNSEEIDQISEEIDQEINSKNEEIIKKDQSEIFESDLFDINAIGCDISKEEFLENEIFFEMIGDR